MPLRTWGAQAEVYCSRQAFRNELDGARTQAAVAAALAGFGPLSNKSKQVSNSCLTGMQPTRYVNNNLHPRADTIAPQRSLLISKYAKYCCMHLPASLSVLNQYLLEPPITSARPWRDLHHAVRLCQGRPLPVAHGLRRLLELACAACTVAVHCLLPVAFDVVSRVRQEES